MKSVTKNPKFLSKSVAVLVAVISPWLAFGIGQAPIVEFRAEPGSFPLVNAGAAALLHVDEHDWPGVIRAANDLRSDIGRVVGIAPVLAHDPTVSASHLIVVGTIGKSRLIDQWIREKRLEVAPIAGKWEATLIDVVNQPMPGIESALVIAGSDKRGTIYGLYTLSEQMGVSPWHWWADVPVRRQNALFVRAGRYVVKSPAVKYRGIFLNDEAPALTGWAREKFGGLNHRFYTNVFELLLRLKANYLWPAMWDNSFATDDPLNARLADEYGIVLGTSHHEPMMRAWKEWGRAGNGPHSWDYSKNAAKLRAFWTEGLRRTRDYEKIITLGMRGDGDEPMTETESVALLEQIVSDQRKLLGEIIRPDIKEVPQSWALYKEVQGYFQRGMRVPDDVTLLWCDDNWGNLRRLPTPAEQPRSGGAGIYYHFDYVGGPRNYKWLNTVPLPKIWEQLNLAYRHNARRIWIVNVGDLKPMEIPIEFFLTYAWNPERWTQNDLDSYLRLWATREFGAAHATDIADLVAKYTKYNGRRKPELLEPDTFSLVNYNETDRIVAEWRQLLERAETISAQLPPESRDAFFELVLHPIKACDIVNELYVTVARNHLYAVQGRASANDYAAKARDLFQADASLTDYFHHQLAGGKWDRMMSQTHIGYTNWQQPPANLMPAVREIDLAPKASLGVAVEGATEAWPDSSQSAKLPDFDAFNRPRRYIDVFNRGSEPLDFHAEASAPWILLSASRGTVPKEQRLWVSVDWDHVPTGSVAGSVITSGPAAEPIRVEVNAFNPPASLRGSLRGFVEADGYVAIDARDYSAHRDTADSHWESLPDHGLTGSAMTVFPVTAPSVTPPLNSPCLEYELSLFSTGRVNVALLLSPSLNYFPARGVRIGVSFDDAAPQILTVVPKDCVAGDGNRDWEECVRNSIRLVKSEHTLSQPGAHTLKVWMVDPGVVLQRLLVNTGGLRPSYLGPPESFRLENSVPTQETVAGDQLAGEVRAIPRTDANSRLAHQQLVQKAQHGGIDAYFLGDSITRRWGATDAQYRPLLENWRTNFFGWNAANFGWGGDRIENILWRVMNGELDGVNPKVIVLLAGINNIGTDPGGPEKVASITAGLNALVKVCREKAPRATLIITAIFPRNDDLAVIPTINQVNGNLARMADGKKTRFLNINDRLADREGRLFPGMMNPDQLHPTLKAYQVWADALKPILTEVLGPPATTDHAPPPTGDPSAKN